MWSYDHRPGSKAVAIKVNMFGSASLSFGVGRDDRVVLTQTSNWPWEGDVQFTLTAPDSISTTMAVRIPVWAAGWKVGYKACVLGS